MKHQPATPLPWVAGKAYKSSNFGGRAAFVQGEHSNIGRIYGGKDAASIEADANYIAHAANAYPRLVEALRVFAKEYCADARVPDSEPFDPIRKAHALLRELGEA